MYLKLYKCNESPCQIRLGNQRQGKSTFQDLSTILDLKGRGGIASSNAPLRRKTKCRSRAVSHSLQVWTREQKSFIPELTLTWTISQNKTSICLNWSSRRWIALSVKSFQIILNKRNPQLHIKNVAFNPTSSIFLIKHQVEPLYCWGKNGYSEI